MSTEELEWLAIQASARRAIIELGSWKGRSTKALSMATPGVVIAIDHWMGSEGERSSYHEEAAKIGQEAMLSIFRGNLRPEIESGKTIPVIGHNSEVAPYVGHLLDARGLQADMLFIDSDHSYARVKEDINNYLPMVRLGGLVCGHDYNSLRQGVIDAVNYTFGKPDSIVGSIWSVTRRDGR